MASGFNATAFSTGLLGNLNAQAANAAKLQNEGQLNEFKNFQDAASEYDKSKAKAAEDSNKIEALANVVSGGKPDTYAYSVARTGLELGYTGSEHLPYLQDAYKKTKAAAQANPDAWNVQAQQPTTYDEDSNPNQTRMLQRFGNTRSTDELEHIRNHDVTKPYSNLPSAQFGDYGAFQNQQLAAKTTTELNAKATAAQNATPDWSEPTGDANQNPNPTMTPPQVPGAPGQQGMAAPPPSAGIAINASSLDPEANGGATGPQTGAATPPPTPQQLPPPSQGNSVPQPGMVHDQINANMPPVNQPSYGEAKTGINLNWDYLHSLPQTKQPQVQAIAEGRLNINDVVRGRGKDTQAERQSYLNAVMKFDPTWDENQFKSRQVAMAAVNNPNTKVGQQISSANRLAQHLDLLDKSIDTLPNYHAVGKGPNENRPSSTSQPFDKQADEGLGLATSLQNKGVVAYHSALGDGSYSKFNQYKDAVAKETERLWRGTGGNSTEIQQKLQELNASSTPEELHASVDGLVNLIQGQIEPTQHAYDVAMGPHTKDILSPKSREIYDRLGAKYNAGQQQQPTQQGTPAFGQSGQTQDYSALWR